jgi:hypothetical protein
MEHDTQTKPNSPAKKNKPSGMVSQKKFLEEGNPLWI